MALDTCYIISIYICHNFPICIGLMMIYKDFSSEQQLAVKRMHSGINIKYPDFLLSTECPVSIHMVSGSASQGQTNILIWCLYIFSYFQPAHQSAVTGLELIYYLKSNFHHKLPNWLVCGVNKDERRKLNIKFLSNKISNKVLKFFLIAVSRRTVRVCQQHSFCSLLSPLPPLHCV